MVHCKLPLVPFQFLPTVHPCDWLSQLAKTTPQDQFWRQKLLSLLYASVKIFKDAWIPPRRCQHQSKSCNLLFGAFWFLSCCTEMSFLSLCRRCIGIFFWINSCLALKNIFPASQPFKICCSLWPVVSSYMDRFASFCSRNPVTP